MRHPAVLAIVTNFLLVSVLSRTNPVEAASPGQVPFTVEQDDQTAAILPDFSGLGGIDKPDYSREQVWRLDLDGLEEGERESVREVIELMDLDIWRSAQSSLDIRLPSHLISPLRSLLPEQTNLTLFIPDLYPLISASSSPIRTVAEEEWDVTSLDTPFHDHYHPLADMYRFAKQLVAAFNGRIIDDGKLKMEVFTVGKSWEGLEMKGVRVKWVPESSKPTRTATPSPLPTETGTMEVTNEELEGVDDNSTESKKKKGKKGGKGKKSKKIIEREFVIQSGSHAREWVGPSSAIYFLHSLLLAGTSDPEADEANLLKAFTFTVVPTINPDGYEYSREHRLWRKNRQDVGSRTCSGIDLNSNWGYKWRKPLRGNPCSDAYPGEKAFEAYETKAMANYLDKGVEWADDFGGKKKKGPERKVRAFVDLHSYGQLFMFPFAHSCDDFPPDAEMLMEAALGVAKAMRADHGETYQTGQACELTYRAPGDAIDYAYGTSDIRWSYSAELRDTGTYGFLLPPHLIRAAADEITTGLVHLAKFIYNVEIVN